MVVRLNALRLIYGGYPTYADITPPEQFFLVPRVRVDRKQCKKVGGVGIRSAVGEPHRRLGVTVMYSTSDLI